MAFCLTFLFTSLLAASYGVADVRQGSSELDDDVRAAVVVTQLALTEQSSVLSQHSQVLGRILDSFQKQQQSSERLSAALEQMSLQVSQALTNLPSAVSRAVGLQSTALTRALREQTAAIAEPLKEIAEVLSEKFEHLSTLSVENSGSESQGPFEELSQPSTSPTPVSIQVANTPQSGYVSTFGHRCPQPFTKVSNECFYVSQDQKTWNDGRQACRDLGGDLATPSDFDNFLNFTLNKLEMENWRSLFTGTGGVQVWLGASQLKDRGKWTYTDGTEVDPTFKNYIISHHVNRQLPIYCLAMEHSAFMPLYITDCDIFKYYTCEHALIN